MGDMSFSQIPANWNLPLVSIEVDSSKAGTLTLVEPALLVGQMFTSGAQAGSATPNVAIPIGSKAQAAAAFGAGSMLERMCARFFDTTPAALLWCMPQAEPGAGNAATGNVVYSGPATSAGTLPIYIAGQIVNVAVSSGMTAAQLATAVAAAISANIFLPVTAAVDGSNTAKVNYTCKWKGTTGNDIKIGHAVGGSLAGEYIPAGISAVVTAMSGGSGAPDQSASIAAIGDDEFDYVAVPYTDSTSLGAWETEYGFTSSGRWGFLRESYGTIYSAVRDTYSNLVTWGAAGNSPVSSVLSIETGAQTPVWEWAASYCADAAGAFLNDPARPLQTLELVGCMPPTKGNRFSKTERNNLTQYGLATYYVDSAGKARIEVERTRYQKNAYGQADNAYFVATTLATLSYILRFLRARITSRYPRHKLANDGARIAPGQAILTPKIVKADLVAAYSELVYRGIAENLSAFKDALVVSRNTENPDRLDILYPPDLVNGLRVFAVLAQFRLQYPDQAGATA